MIFLVFIEAMVGANCIRRDHRVVVSCYVKDVRALDGEAYEVFAVTSVLRRTQRFQSAIAIPLIKRLVASAPRGRTQVVTVLVGRVRRVFLCPFVGRFIVAVLCFNYFPLIG